MTGREVQQLEALAKGNDIRRRRARLKPAIKAGEQDVVRLLQDPPEWIDSMAVTDLLLAQPRWGNAKVHRTLSQCQVSPFATVGGLTSRQRRALVQAVR